MPSDSLCDLSEIGFSVDCYLSEILLTESFVRAGSLLRSLDSFQCV